MARLHRHAKFIFKRAQRGLFAGEYIRFGDQKSEFGNRSKRSWKPNIQSLAVHSASLNKQLIIKVSPTAQRRIADAGGLDQYILNQQVPESDFANALQRRILIEQHLSVIQSNSTRISCEEDTRNQTESALQQDQIEKTTPTIKSLDRDVQGIIEQLHGVDLSSFVKHKYSKPRRLFGATVIPMPFSIDRSLPFQA